MSDTNELRAVKLTASALAIHAAIHIVRSQPLYPDTHTGKRQQWVKDEIERKLLALLSTSDARAPSVEEGKHG